MTSYATQVAGSALSARDADIRTFEDVACGPVAGTDPRPAHRRQVQRHEERPAQGVLPGVALLVCDCRLPDLRDRPRCDDDVADRERAGDRERQRVALAVPQAPRPVRDARATHPRDRYPCERAEVHDVGEGAKGDRRVVHGTSLALESSSVDGKTL